MQGETGSKPACHMHYTNTYTRWYYPAMCALAKRTTAVVLLIPRTCSNRLLTPLRREPTAPGRRALRTNVTDRPRHNINGEAYSSLFRITQSGRNSKTLSHLYAPPSAEIKVSWKFHELPVNNTVNPLLQDNLDDDHSATAK